MKKNQGREVEDLVQKLCAKMFISDFVVKSPKFKKENGQEKEAADVLVLFKSTLITYQVKSKIELKKVSEKSSVDFKRIENKIDEGIGQINTTRNAIKNNLIKNVLNSIGVTIPFKSEIYTKMIGIVVLDLLGEEDFPEDERTRIHNGFQIQKDMSIHIFLREDLEIISSELDTIPDFLNFLIKREECFKKGILLHHTAEKDFLALYKFNLKIINEALLAKKTTLLCLNNSWEYYTANHKSNIDERNKENLLVDDIIAILHTTIGFSPDFVDLEIRNDLTQGSVENYFASATELASLDRISRRRVGQMFLTVMRNANTSDSRCSIIIDKEKRSAIVVFSSRRSRKERATTLQHLAHIAYCKFNLKKVLVLASEHENSKERSFDFMYIENVSHLDCVEILRNAKNYFLKPNYFP